MRINKKNKNVKFTYRWLLDHLETTLSANDIANKLTDLGIEIEEITDYCHIFNNIIVGYILKAEKHPNADKLQICQVDIGNTILQIVCGAQNARSGIYVAVALPGAVIPKTKEILKKGKIRGVESQGMMCSAEELQIFTTSEIDGIIELPENSNLGKNITEALHLDDVVFDVSITPNRADCFSVRGIARDLAAAQCGNLRPMGLEESNNNLDILMGLNKQSSNLDRLIGLEEASNKLNKLVSDYKPTHQTVFAILSSYFKNQNCSINNQSIPNDIELNLETDNCHYFSTLSIRNFSGTTPEFIQTRLQLIGQKLISCPVDIANYICFDLGHPMHVFDLDKLPKSLHIRNSKAGEQLHTLNNKIESLNNDSIVVADNNIPLTLAGVIGGVSTSVSNVSKNLLIESSYFNKVAITKTGQALNITTDARTRFERGVDPQNVKFALVYFAYLLNLVNQNIKVSSIKEVGNLPINSNGISLTYDKFTNLTGFSNSEFQLAVAILQSLGCIIQQKTETYITVMTPPWRHDLNIEEDLIEEVVRIIGLDKIKSIPLPIDNFSEDPGKANQNEINNKNPIYRNTLDTHQKLQSIATDENIKNLTEALIYNGYFETKTFTLIDKNTAKLFANSYIELQSTLSNEFSVLRPTIIASHLKSVIQAQCRSQETVKIFELGKQFNICNPISNKGDNKGVENYCEGPQIVMQNNIENELNLEKASKFPADNKMSMSEENTICATVSELVHHRHWKNKSSCSVFDIKEDVENLLHLTGGTFRFINSASDFYHPGRCGSYIYQKDIIVAQFGEIHPSILLHLGIKSKVMCFEIFVNRLSNLKANKSQYIPYSQYQAVTRDFSFIVNKSCPAENIISSIKKLHINEIRNINIFDVYTAPSIGEDKKAIGIEIKIQSDTKTLIDSEINDISNIIISSIEQKCNGILRS